MTETTDEPTMTGAEFRCLREYLGLTNAWLADYLGVHERSVNRWGDDISPIPPGIADDMQKLDADAAMSVDAGVAHLRTTNSRTWTTWRTDDALHAAHPDDGHTAQWHRAIAARIRERVAGVVLEFGDE